MASSSPPPLSAALEDYLETVYLLVQEQGFARVRDIARARAVKAATVSVALRKLAEGALVNYERREYIGLTAKGEDAARKVLSRHRLLTRFFEQVLRMPHEAASDQACTMEHSLTDEAMGRLVTFFEAIGDCRALVEAFGRFPDGVDEVARSGSFPCRLDRASGAHGAAASSRSLAQLTPGQQAVVTQIKGGRALRQRILNMGLLPDTAIALERVGDGGDSLWIRCEGAQLRLRRGEARVVRVRDAQ